MAISSLYAVFLLFLFSITVGCTPKENAVAEAVPKIITKSPFSGKWVSEDSDKETAFMLTIEQLKDSLFGHYCLVWTGGQKCDCYSAELMRQQYAFAVPVSGESTLETPVNGNWNSQVAGRLRLSAVDNKLYWRIVEEQSDRYFMIKQTTFVRDTSFH